MDYKERIAQEQLIREVRLSVYMNMISKIFDGKDTYEATLPIEKIELNSIIYSHQKLLNRIEA